MEKNEEFFAGWGRGVSVAVLGMIASIDDKTNLSDNLAFF